MKVVLPWPDKRLSPNARVHWRAKVGPKKSARADATNATYAALGRGLREVRAAMAGNTPIGLTITFYPPDARRRDRDNMQGSLKHALDGIADALGVDDYRFRPTYHFADPEAPGRVVVEIRGVIPHCAQLLRTIISEVSDGPINGLPPEEQEAA